MGEKYLMIPLCDLRYLEIRCPQCHTVFCFDIEEQAFLPSHCPCCPAEWQGQDSTIMVEAFSAYKKFFKLFGTKGMKMNPYFRVKSEEKT